MPVAPSWSARPVGEHERVDVSAPPTREILATGDFVPGFGRVGTFGFRLNGIDERGRLLLYGDISDGRRGLFWADGKRITTVWSNGQYADEGIELWPFHSGTSPDGRILVGGSGDPHSNAISAFYVIDGRTTPEAVAVATRDRAANGSASCPRSRETGSRHQTGRHDRLPRVTVAGDEECTARRLCQVQQFSLRASETSLERSCVSVSASAEGGVSGVVRLIGLADDDGVLFQAEGASAAPARSPWSSGGWRAAPSATRPGDPRPVGSTAG